MSNYKLPVVRKKTREDSYKQLFIRIEDVYLQNAIRSAIEHSGMSSQKLILDMIKHCLTETGFLK